MSEENILRHVKDKNNDSVWTEKYRPQNLEEFFGNKTNIETAKEWLYQFESKSDEFKPILLLTGPPGTGKTSLAYILFNEVKYDIVEINASKLEGKTDINRHFNNITSGGLSMLYGRKGQIGVILDEVDGMAQNEITMNEFLSIIDPVIKKKSFEPVSKKMTHIDKLILNAEKMAEKANTFKYKYPIICTANDISDKRMKKLLKKACVINIEQPTETVFKNYATKLITGERIKIKPEALDLLIKRSHLDYRQLISNCQIISAYKKEITVVDITLMIKEKDIDENLIETLQQLFRKKQTCGQMYNLSDSDDKTIGNMVYHTLIPFVENCCTGKKQDKVNTICDSIIDIANSQKYGCNKYIISKKGFDDKYAQTPNPVEVIDKIVKPIYNVNKLGRNNNQMSFETPTFVNQNYRSLEGKNYVNYIAYFLDKFGPYSSKNIFDMCHTILCSLVELLDEKHSYDTNEGLRIMKQYKLSYKDINKMFHVCVLDEEIHKFAHKFDAAKVKRQIEKILPYSEDCE